MPFTNYGISDMDDVIDKKQKLLLEYMLSEVEVFVKCYSIAKPDYFSKPLDRVVEFVLLHFKKYGNKPTFAMVEAETGILLKRRDMDLDSDLLYFLDEFEQFCREQAMAKAILSAVDLVNDGKVNLVESLVREAMMVKLDTNLGVSIMEDVEDRIINMSEVTQSYSLGIDELDETIGFVRRGELIIFAASSSGGKSLMLTNSGIALAKQGLDVVVISVELSEQLYAKRFDAMLSGIDIASHTREAKRIGDKLSELKKKLGNITVKYMHPMSNASDFRAYLLEYSLEYGKYPDVLIVDYIAHMGTSKDHRGNKFDADEEKAIELRRMGSELDMIVLSAQQLNRTAASVIDVNYSHIAGGISLINVSDATIAMVATDEDLDNNQVQVKGIKVRNAQRSSKSFTVYKCPKTLRMSNKPFFGNDVPNVSKGKDKLKSLL